jgi:glutathionylspermidine synthase
MKFKNLAKAPTEVLNLEGWNWVLGEDTLPYLVNEMVVVSSREAEQYYEATNSLYEMYCEAAQNVIDNKRYSELGIPAELIPMIEHTWENENHWHLYGRFDLSGGLDHSQIKLIEFNADTATCIPETAILQWASLKANGLDNSEQFNTLYEALVNNFIDLKSKNRQKDPAILFTTMAGFPEDDANVAVLSEAAKAAGFTVEYSYIEDVEFSEDEGIFKSNEDGTFTRYDFWFKLVPWEFIAWDEPELVRILTNLVTNEKVVIVNPAYTLLFQSKAILKVLWEIYPYHPLLLNTSDKQLYMRKNVEKAILGREGANINIISPDGKFLDSRGGDYKEQKTIFQEYTDFVKDTEGRHYQAGVFFAGEACGLGYRRGGEIIDNKAQFCGHIVE